MGNTPKVLSVNISTEKGTIKLPVDQAVVDEMGLSGDAHAGIGHRQVSLLAIEAIRGFAHEEKRNFAPGEFAENITLEGLDLGRVGLLDRLRIGSILLEVTQIGKSCHGDGCAIFREVGRCVMPTGGIFCRVLNGGTLCIGDPVEHLHRPLVFKVITVSDRASRGDYLDRSGPRIREMLEVFFEGKRWHPEIEGLVLPDHAARLREELMRSIDAGTDVIITTGGTGVGPRDVTPETVQSLCDKLLPGIMEAIRVKFGLENPNALLSRGIAGVAGETLLYTLPGSRRGTEEYMGEILKTLEHLVLMIHGVDAH